MVFNILNQDGLWNMSNDRLFTFVIGDLFEEKGFFEGYVLCSWIFGIKHHFQILFFKYPK